MSVFRRAFYVCAFVILVLELLSLAREPGSGPSTAEIEGIIARSMQTQPVPASDVRCVRPASGAATCIATLWDGSRVRVAAAVNPVTGRVTSTVGR